MPLACGLTGSGRSINIFMTWGNISIRLSESGRGWAVSWEDPVLCALYSVLCFLYSVLCTLYSVFCTLYSELCTLYSVLCFLYSVFCTLFSVLCTLYSVLCTLFSVLCTLYSVFCTLYSLLCFLYSVLSGSYQRDIINLVADRRGSLVQGVQPAPVSVSLAARWTDGM